MRGYWEEAKIIFKKGDTIIGFGKVTGGANTTWVDYYLPNWKYAPLERVHFPKVAFPTNDQHDPLFKFKFPKMRDGEELTFDKVEFTGFGEKDDYLVREISYTQEAVEFDIQVDKRYPPKGKATAVVEVAGKKHLVDLDQDGHGKLTLREKDVGGNLSKVTAKVIEIKDGGYENPIVNKSESFDVETYSNIIRLDANTSGTHHIKLYELGDIPKYAKFIKLVDLPSGGRSFWVIDSNGKRHNAFEDEVIKIDDLKSGKIHIEVSPEYFDMKFKVQFCGDNGYWSDGNIIKADSFSTVISGNVYEQNGEVVDSSWSIKSVEYYGKLYSPDDKGKISVGETISVDANNGDITNILSNKKLS